MRLRPTHIASLNLNRLLLCVQIQPHSELHWGLGLQPLGGLGMGMGGGTVQSVLASVTGRFRAGTSTPGWDPRGLLRKRAKLLRSKGWGRRWATTFVNTTVWNTNRVYVTLWWTLILKSVWPLVGVTYKKEPQNIVPKASVLWASYLFFLPQFPYW